MSALTPYWSISLFEWSQAAGTGLFLGGHTGSEEVMFLGPCEDLRALGLPITSLHEDVAFGLRSGFSRERGGSGGTLLLPHLWGL